MKISELLLPFYQKSLIFAGLEYIAACDMLPALHGGQFGKDSTKWKSEVIGFLNFSLENDLLKPAAKNYANFSACQFCRLFESSDLLKDSDVWLGVQFISTDKLSELLENHGLLDWSSINAPVNVEFMQSLTSSP